MMSLRCPEPLCRLTLGLVLGALLWGMLVPVVSAQQTRTLNIQDGTVYVDGRPLSADQLPDGLDLQDVSAQYRFVGIRRPVVELNGRLFAVEEGLTPVTEEEVREERGSVVLHDGPSRSPSPQKAASPARTSGEGRSIRPEADHREYLEAVQRSSRELYERLQRERQMEQNAQALARTVRLLPEGPKRRAKIDTLRALLEDIFEVKQENRRREMKRLQRQMRKLKKNLRKREQMRDRMIDRHLRQLIDSTRGR